MFNPFLQKSNLKNYISNIVEIGYSQYGPTLALAGNMTAIHKVAFVYNMTLEIQRKSSTDKYKFSWFAFRPHKFNMGGFTGIDLKMASKFMVSPSESFNYNILFADQNRYAEMSLYLKQLRREWEKIIDTHGASSSANFQSLFEDFIKRDFVMQALSRLEAMCYWQEDEYLLKIMVAVKDLEEALEVERYFSLTAPDAASLKRNAPMIIADLCKQPKILYNYACPNLQ